MFLTKHMLLMITVAQSFKIMAQQDVNSGQSSVFTRCVSPFRSPTFLTQTWAARCSCVQTGTGLCWQSLPLLKYVHVSLCATQCASVNAQSCVCGAGIFFASDQRSGWAAACPAWIKMQCLDRCCVHRPGPPWKGGVWVGWGGGL